MKTQFAVALLLMGSLGAPAQGTVELLSSFLSSYDGAPILQTFRIYVGPGTFIGNGTGDVPAGTRYWTGFTALTGSGWMAALRAANGANEPESTLTFGLNPTVTTFRSGQNAGRLASKTATLNQVLKDAPVATLELFVWNDVGGTVTDPHTAWNDWQSGFIAAGTFGPFNETDIGGDINTPANLNPVQSFSIEVPEPSVLALAGLGAVALLAFRKQSRLV